MSDAPLGFFVGGSTLEALNGVYGPRIDPRNPEALEHLQQKENLGEFAEYAKGGLGAYRHDHSGWWLVHAALAPGSEHSEWVFVDEAGQRRFRHDGNTLIPGSGKRWSQLTPSARAQAPPSESTQIRVQGEVPPLEDGDELPWQLIGVRSREMLENLRRGDRHHRRTTEEAEARRGLPRPPPGDEPPPVEAAEAAAARASTRRRRRCTPRRRRRPTARGRRRSPAPPRARRAARRDFGTVHLALDAAVRAFPRYTAALLERGISYLDERRNAKALTAFERTLAVDGTAPAIDEWIIRAAAAQRRAAPPATSASAAADELAARRRRLAAMPLPDGCERLVFGKSQGAHRKVATLSDASRVVPHAPQPDQLAERRFVHRRLRAAKERGAQPRRRRRGSHRPARRLGIGPRRRVLRARPLATPPYDVIAPDEADERAAAAAEAKGAEETPEERGARGGEAAAAAEAARFRSACHYEVLGVPVDFTAAELKGVPRALAAAPPRPRRLGRGVRARGDGARLPVGRGVPQDLPRGRRGGRGGRPPRPRRVVRREDRAQVLPGALPLRALRLRLRGPPGARGAAEKAAADEPAARRTVPAPPGGRAPALSPAL